MDKQSSEILIVTEYFHPDTAATGQLLTDLAVGLADRGLNVSVYTSKPNYHGVGEESLPRTENYKGVQIRRSPVPQLQQDSMIKRGINWSLFTLSAFLALLISRSEKQREILFVSNPPMLPAALWLVCRLRGWSYTYVVHDIYPEFLIQSGFLERGFISRSWQLLTTQTYRDASDIIALGPRMKELIVDQAGPQFDPDTVSIIHNWADPDFIRPKQKENNWFSKKHGLVDTFTILYSGNIGYNHDLETAIRAMAKMKDKEVQLLIIGEGDRKEELVKLATDLELIGDTVKFLPYQDKEDLPYSVTAGDVSLVAVESGMEGICVSSKLYTALAAGQPILVISEPSDDEARIITEGNAGFQAAPGEVEQVQRIVERWRTDDSLIDTQGENARNIFEQNFTKDQSIDEYYEVLNS